MATPANSPVSPPVNPLLFTAANDSYATYMDDVMVSYVKAIAVGVTLAYRLDL